CERGCWGTSRTRRLHQGREAPRSSSGRADLRDYEGELDSRTAAEGNWLLVDQVFLPHREEGLQRLSPLRRNEAWIDAGVQVVHSLLICYQARDLIDLEVVWIKLVQCRRNFRSQSRGIQRQAIRHNDVHASALLVG